MTTVIVWTLIVGLALVIPFWRVFQRAGFAPALSLIAFVPLLGPFVCLLILGLRPWPTTRAGVE